MEKEIISVPQGMRTVKQKLEACLHTLSPFVNKKREY